MRVVSWNVNSVRARTEHLESVIARHQPHVLLLQETRCTDAQFPRELFLAHGYEVVHHGRDHRNGVAIASRIAMSDVRSGFAGAVSFPFDETRSVSALIDGIRMYSVYVPNGRTLDDDQYTYKLAWLDRLRADISAELTRGEDVLVAGDFNVAPADIDIYDPSRFRRTTHASPPERMAIAALLELGLTDVMRQRLPDPGVYTWWSHAAGQFGRNRGLRIDLVLASAGGAGRITGIAVDVETRGLTRASDHAPVVVDLDASTG